MAFHYLPLLARDDKHIPLCWKCSSAEKRVIVAKHQSNELSGLCWELSGCKSHKRIRTYADAQRWCPALPKNRK